MKEKLWIQKNRYSSNIKYYNSNHYLKQLEYLPDWIISIQGKDIEAESKIRSREEKIDQLLK